MPQRMNDVTEYLNAINDARDGTMTGVTGPMPPLQAETLEWVPDRWMPVMRLGVHEAILRALVERRLVETRWENGIRQWRRKAPAEATP